jgi:AcrR family transcriptional regulator
VGASLGDIAKSVGIRKPSLLYHFGSKDDLRRSVLEDMLARWNEVVPRLLVAATAGPQQFDAVVDETVAFFREDPDRARLMLREVLDRPNDIRPLLEAHVKPWATIVANYIRKGQEHGRVRLDVDPEAYVVQMINLVIGSVATYQGTRPLLDEREGTEDVDAHVLERTLTELVRVAKSSLFADPGDPGNSGDARDAGSKDPAESAA